MTCKYRVWAVQQYFGSSAVFFFGLAGCASVCEGKSLEGSFLDSNFRVFHVIGSPFGPKKVKTESTVTALGCSFVFVLSL